jgi:O-antigen/teichoic acid export membrane protein
MSSRKALAFSFLDRYAGLLLSIVSSMIVARLLTPAEIGVFSVSMVLLSFISAMRDFGAGQYLVQEKELTPERVRATWAVQLGLGLGFAAIVLAAAVPASHFYAEPRLRDILFVLALNFAISPFGSLTYAWLMREMRFDALALMRFAGGFTGACVSVVMAWTGHGAISLAAGSLAATVANAVLATYFRPRWFPWRPSLHGVRRVLSFGGKVSATTVMNSISYGVPELVLGKLQGMVAVGLYSRANGLASMFHRLILDATQSVATPLFSKATREGVSIAPIFVQATAYVTAVGWSFFIVMIVLAESIVRVLYGPQWEASVPLTRLIAAGMAVGLPTAFCTAALMATGAVDTLMRNTLFAAIQYALLLGVAAAFGPLSLAGAVVVAAGINVAIWLKVVHRRIAFAWSGLSRMLVRSAAVAAVTGAAASPALLLPLTGTSSHVWRLVIGVPLAAVAFTAAVFASGHPLRDECQKMYQMLRSRWTSATASPG